MTFDPNALKLYVDGSCKPKNPGSGGWALFVEYPDSLQKEDEQLDSRGYKQTTNNRMELLGLIAAFDWIADADSSLRNSRIQIITDSEYVKKGLAAAQNWRGSGWKTRDGIPALNSDLWRILLNRRQKSRGTIHIHRTDGKKSAILKAVDKAAKAAAEQPTETDYGYIPGKVGKSAVKSGKASQLFDAKGQEASIHVYLSSVYRGGVNLIKFNLANADGSCSGKYRACATPSVGSSLHRHHKYLVQFNDNPKNPQIMANLAELK